MDEDTFHAAAKDSASWLEKTYGLAKDAGSAFVGAFGLPSTMDEVRQANAALPQQLSHPIQTAEDIASATGKGIVGMLPASNPALLTKAKTAWQSADHITAARHLINYLTPLVGSASDTAGDQAQAGKYGTAAGSTAATVLPMLLGKLFGGAPETPVEPTAPKQTVTQPETVAPKSVAEPMSPVDRAAASYIAKNRFEVPEIEVVDARNPVDDAGTVNLGGKSQQVRGAQQAAEVDTAADNLEAQKILNRRAAEEAIARDPVNQLAAVKAKLNVKTGKTAGVPETASKTPVTDADIARLKTRANTKGTYSAEPSANGLYTKHTVNLTTSGKPSGSVVAIEDPSEPNILRIESADSTTGNHTGRDFGYTKLLDQAQKMANERGEPVTVNGGSVQSPQAKATWRALERQHGYDVKWNQEAGQEGTTPSVTFKPKSATAVKPAPVVKPQLAAGFVGRALESQGVQPNWTSAITGEQPEGLIDRYHRVVDRSAAKPIDLTSDWESAAKH
jgi:hypothetical protein